MKVTNILWDRDAETRKVSTANKQTKNIYF